jgi:RNA polymerase sigma-70 factor (ECF subfamily)
LTALVPKVNDDDPRPSWSSLRLLWRARGGDRAALDALFERLLPSLRRWARGRLPVGPRGGLDTDDLVQDAALGALRHLESFEPRRQHALRAYLRQAVRNRVRDALRQRQRRPAPAEIDEQAPAGGPSPLHAAIEAENASRYRAGLERLRPEERELVVARLELGYSYEQIALALGRASPDAVRVAVRRAMLRLAEVMGGD